MTPSTSSMDPLQELPVELVEVILGYLPLTDLCTVQRVCKKWCCRVQLSRLWITFCRNEGIIAKDTDTARTLFNTLAPRLRNLGRDASTTCPNLHAASKHPGYKINLISYCNKKIAAIGEGPVPLHHGAESMYKSHLLLWDATTGERLRLHDLTTRADERIIKLVMKKDSVGILTLSSEPNSFLFHVQLLSLDDFECDFSLPFQTQNDHGNINIQQHVHFDFDATINVVAIVNAVYEEKESFFNCYSMTSGSCVFTLPADTEQPPIYKLDLVTPKDMEGVQCYFVVMNQPHGLRIIQISKSDHTTMKDFYLFDNVCPPLSVLIHGMNIFTVSIGKPDENSGRFEIKAYSLTNTTEDDIIHLDRRYYLPKDTFDPKTSVVKLIASGTKFIIVDKVDPEWGFHPILCRVPELQRGKPPEAEIIGRFNNSSCCRQYSTCLDVCNGDVDWLSGLDGDNDDGMIFAHIPILLTHFQRCEIVLTKWPQKMPVHCRGEN